MLILCKTLSFCLISDFTDTHPICMQVVVPRTDVNEHSSQDDDLLNRQSVCDLVISSGTTAPVLSIYNPDAVV